METAGLRFVLCSTVLIWGDVMNTRQLIHRLLAWCVAFVLLVWAADPVLAQSCFPWTGVDVGTGGVAGSLSCNSGTFTVTGHGTIEGTADRFFFAYQTYTGDFELVARLVNLDFQPNQTGPVGGIMVREDLDADSRYVFVTEESKVEPPDWLAGRRIGNQARTRKGDRTVGGIGLWKFANDPSMYDPSSPFGDYHKLVRYKDQITVYGSTDSGATWRHLEGWTLPGLTASVRVGMAVAPRGFWFQDPNLVATATFDQVSLKPLVLTHHTSWAGNSLPGGSTSIMHNVQDMYVEPDPVTGRIFASTFWEESAKEGSIFTPNGDFYDSLDEAHPFRGNYAITSNGAYVYIGMMVSGTDPTDPAEPGYPQSPNVRYAVRRYTRDGRVAPVVPQSQCTTTLLKETYGYDCSMRFVCETNKSVDRHIRGLAWHPNSAWGAVLLASDTMANRIRMYDQNLDPVAGGEFPANPDLDQPRDIAVDSNGDLWIIAQWNGYPQVLKYQSNGAKYYQPQLYATGWDPTDLIVSAGLIWVADAGPDQQIKKFYSDGTSAGSFGTLGGILSGTKGRVDAARLKLNNPVGVGVDSSGNIYVAGDGGAGVAAGGAEFRKFNSSGILQWERVGLEFVEVVDADPGTDGKDLYSRDQHYGMDYSKSTGLEWSYKGMTLDRFTYPDDPRLHGVAEGIYIRRYQGKRFLFTATGHGTFLAGWRFESDTSEIAIPSVLFVKVHFPGNPSWPTNQPPTQPESQARWMWRDDNGDGRIDSNEYPADMREPNENVWGWYVDDSLNIWTTAWRKDDAEIRVYKLKGLDPVHGNPIYGPGTGCWGSPSDCIVNYTTPALFREVGDPETTPIEGVMRSVYVPATDTLYLGGYNEANPLSPPPIFGEFGMVGRVVARYNNWTTDPTHTPVWSTVLPFDPLYDVWKAGKGLDVAGNRVYVGMADTRKILVYEAATGTLLKSMQPGPEVAGESGWLDTIVSLNAFQRSNGDYLVFAEEDYSGKALIYREAPTPLYLETFSGGNPFLYYNPGTGGSVGLETIGGSVVVRFRDTTAGFPAGGVSLFRNTLGSGHPLVSRINQVYALPGGSPAVDFEMNFTLERKEASNKPDPAAITVGVILNEVGGGINVITGTPSIYNSLAYQHNEAAGSEVLELVDRNWSSSFRFTIVPNGGATVVDNLQFQFGVRVLTPVSSTPESYYVDNLTAFEVVP